jgi:iron(III) transport system substrate-binding protein
MKAAFRWVAAVAIFAATILIGCRREDGDGSTGKKASANGTVVLYCAVDREIAQDLIDQFEKETGIHVEAKFDTEAAKAVGLVQAIRQEKAHPQCDVYWGMGCFFPTILADDGCLAPVANDLIQAEGTAPHDSLGRWLGFAATYRVLIVNTNVIAEDSLPHSYRDLTDPKFKDHVGIANPLFGGMAAHVAALFSKLGENGGRQWLEGLKRNDCAICAGMADVKDRVASGELWFGITATDDAHVAMEGGKPVKVVFPDQGADEMGCLDGNSAVALIANAPHPKEAERLIRFLLTAQTEKVLSTGPGQTVGMLPESLVLDVRPAWIPRNVKTMDVDWEEAVKAHSPAAKAIKEILLDQ